MWDAPSCNNCLVCLFVSCVSCVRFASCFELLWSWYSALLQLLWAEWNGQSCGQMVASGHNIKSSWRCLTTWQHLLSFQVVHCDVQLIDVDVLHLQMADNWSSSMGWVGNIELLFVEGQESIISQRPTWTSRSRSNFSLSRETILLKKFMFLLW